MNNNQTCSHQGVAPINLKDCLHLEVSEEICPVCAYEIGFLEGCSKKWNNFEEYISSELQKTKCSIGTEFSKSKFEIIENNKSEFVEGICIACAFKLGFEAANNYFELDQIQLERVETPKTIPVKILG
ncbi:MAG: hypothetical protein ACXIUD_17445 [Mongoliitalea sp.]